jgi:hypothetical protein
MSVVGDLALRHLALRLRPLHRALSALVQQQAEAAARLARPDLTPVCITDEEVQGLLLAAPGWLSPGAGEVLIAFTAEEQAEEQALRGAANAAATELPLDALARLQGLTAFEQQALVLCAAPELERGYERIFGYALDDMNRRLASVELLCAIGAPGARERLARRVALAAHGRLRRSGMLRSWGEAGSTLRQELRLGPGMLDCLAGQGDPRAFGDPAEVDCSDASPQAAIADALARLARGVSQGLVDVVGLWGPPRSGPGEAARHLAHAAARPLRRLLPGEDLRAALETAAALDACLWIALDPIHDEAAQHRRDALAAALATSRVPVLLSGALPWRPIELLSIRTYEELRLPVPGSDEHARWIAQALPELPTAEAGELALQFRVGPNEARAAARSARAAARLAANGHGPEFAPHLRAACATLLRPGSQRYAHLLEPRRGSSDLVLPPALHTQVLEVARFFRAWPQVAQQWGYTRHGSGIKALFTGDSGTGKTLAAEVIAGELAMPLLKIDLSQVVSKWVGETEQHLEALFREAEDSHALLFFDEADALFGRRGEVQHGVDRYANLEVSYLLQRLEDHAGLVVLASNLRDNIDPAFTRRFQVVLHFPRPELRERRALWRIAFPPGAPLDGDLDLEVLARLDLTGASIAGAARTAALLAASEGSTAISRRHVAQGLARQYQREARVLMPGEMGPYAALVRDGP